MTLVRKNAIKPDDITSVLIGMPENSLRVVDNREMHNISVQDMVSANLATGGLKLIDELRAEADAMTAATPDRPRWVLGTQWHPEDSADNDPQQQALFDALLRQV